MKLDEATEQAALLFDTPISAGLATIHLTYTGTLNHDLRGIYIGKQNAMAQLRCSLPWN